MKRIKAACICQTLHFQLKEDLEHSIAVRLVREGVEHYKQALERNRTRHKIVDEAEQEDGSVVIRIIKQYNRSPVGDYLDCKEPVCSADRLCSLYFVPKKAAEQCSAAFLIQSEAACCAFRGHGGCCKRGSKTRRKPGGRRQHGASKSNQMITWTP